MCRSKKKRYVRKRSLTVDEGLEYMTAKGKRKEELESKLNLRKREF